MTLLSIVQEASRRCNIAVPSSVAANTDVDPQRMFGFANEAGKRLMRRHDWQELQAEKTFTSILANLQTSAVPSDFDRMIEGTFWNVTAQQRVVGPLSPQRWRHLASLSASSARASYRLRLGQLYLIGHVADHSMVYEYVSNLWVLASGDTSPTLAAFAADTDTHIFDDEVMILELVWRWKAAKGQPYDEDFRKAEEAIEERIGNDQSASMLDLMPEPISEPLDPSIPEDSWTLT